MSSLLKELTRFIDNGAIDDYLRGAGLKRRESAFGAFGVFMAGAVAGAAVGLLFAPMRGDELRSELTQRMSSLRSDMEEKVQSATKKGERYNPPS